MILLLWKLIYQTLKLESSHKTCLLLFQKQKFYWRFLILRLKASFKGGNLLAAMFGTVEEDDEEDTVEEPQALLRKKAEMDKVATKW